MEGVSISVAVNGDGFDSDSVGGSGDPASYFASVCYQNFVYAFCFVRLFREGACPRVGLEVCEVCFDFGSVSSE